MLKRIPPLSWLLWSVSAVLLALCRWATALAVWVAPEGASISVCVVLGRSTWANFWHLGSIDQLRGLGALSRIQADRISEVVDQSQES